MKKILGCVCWVLLSLLFLSGCGESNHQNKSQSNVTRNTPTKVNDNQAKTYSGWTTIKVEGEIEFQIPPTMELESRDYQVIEQKNAKNLYNIDFQNLVTDGGEILRIVAHQKGLNEHEENAKKQYVRAIVKIQKESEDAYPKWGDNISVSTKDLKYIEEGLINGAIQHIQGIKLVGISQHLKVVKVNGISCLHGKYETQMGSRPIVNNDVYMFWNTNRMYIVQTLIRSTEYKYWTAQDVDVRNIVNTFKPCNS